MRAFGLSLEGAIKALLFATKNAYKAALFAIERETALTKQQNRQNFEARSPKMSGKIEFCDS